VGLGVPDPLGWKTCDIQRSLAKRRCGQLATLNTRQSLIKLMSKVFWDMTLCRCVGIPTFRRNMAPSYWKGRVVQEE
jgi:hypothetical protein